MSTSPVRRVRRSHPVLVTGLIVALVFTGIRAGLVFAPFETLFGLPGGTDLDYRGQPGRAFAPLSEAFIEQQLGIDLVRRPDPLAQAPVDSGPAVPNAEAIGPVAPLLREGFEHPLVNDDREDALEIRAIPFSGRTDASEASREDDEPSSCADGRHTVWYRYTATETATLQGHAIASRDRVSLAVHRGDATLDEVACGNSGLLLNVARVFFDAEAGTTYWFQIATEQPVGDLVFSLDPLGQTERVSVVGENGDPDKATVYVDVSADGRMVVFESWATNLVPGDTNNSVDVFVFDRLTRETRMVSVNSDGEQGNGNSGTFGATISADGRWVGFSSFATNLVEGDTNGRTDTFVHDLHTGQTRRVSVASDGRQGTSPPSTDLYLVQQELCTRVGDHEVAGRIEDPAFRAYNAPIKCANAEAIDFSDDGSLVVFASPLSGLVPNDPTREFDPASPDPTSTFSFANMDVFVHDLRTSETRLVSYGLGGTSGNGLSHVPDISGDGRWVSFQSRATDLEPGFEDTGATQVWVRDLHSGAISLVSVNADGRPGSTFSYDSSLSFDGRWIAFDSVAALSPDDDNNEIDVYLHDRLSGTTSLISVSSVDEEQAPLGSLEPTISADGRFIAFQSRTGEEGFGGEIDRLRAPQANIHLFDRVLGTTTLVSVASDGTQADDSSYFPQISASGQHIVFVSEGSNLDPHDGNNLPSEGDRIDGMDAFIHTLPIVR